MYNGAASKGIAKEALVDRYPRDRFMLATKLHFAYFNSMEDRDRVFTGSLKKPGRGILITTCCTKLRLAAMTSVNYPPLSPRAEVEACAVFARALVD